LKLVGMMKKNTLVVFQDGDAALENTAQAIASGLNAERYAVKLRAASKVSIPEILAAQLYIFGASAEKSPAYGEVARVFTGVNLAGREARYFGSSAAALDWLKSMTKDSELKNAGSDLAAAQPSPSALRDWLKTLD